MYTRFFGFREKPFRLVPNPAYLFLSSSHEEALAHLKYALSQGDGFTTISGEVGTGKTTLCRMFMESLEKDVAAAYIFNPKLNSVELLQAINQEFGIDSDACSVKTLINALNQFLMQAKTAGRNVVLLIDEAQNLSAEVLEQLRLLSNLETTRSKLLQIILVGQPELLKTLALPQLRQLKQRITLNCRLNPLSVPETKQYIRHRLSIASENGDNGNIEWPESALNLVYQFSKGIPRRINIVCDRALLVAFGRSLHHIDRSSVAAAVKELNSESDDGLDAWLPHLRIASIVLVCGAFLALLLYYWPFSHISKSVATTTKSEAFTGQTYAVPKPSHFEVASLREMLQSQQPVSSRRSALKVALSRWKRDAQIHASLNDNMGDLAFFRLGARQYGLWVHTADFNLEQLKTFNLPTILVLSPSGSTDRIYVTLIGIDNEKVVLATKDQFCRASFKELKAVWQQPVYILWRNFYSYFGTLPKNSTPNAIKTLKIHLRDIGFTQLTINAIFDPATRETIKEIQRTHALPVSGKVDFGTKIVLYNLNESLEIPHIAPNKSTFSENDKDRR